MSIPAGAARPGRPAATGPLARPAVIATDLDGTLLRSDGTVSARSRAALAGAAQAGIAVVLVTARPPRWLDALADLVSADGMVLCANGAFDYDVHARRVVATHAFTRAEVLAVAAAVRAALPGVAFAVERADGPRHERAYVDPHAQVLPAQTEIEVLEDLEEAPIGKLLAVRPGLPMDELLRVTAEAVGDRGIVAFSGAQNLAEIGPAGVTKATALQRWCAGRDVRADQVWAFGDMPNDLPMLEWAGESFAVANAHPRVLATARHRCAANDDDGVARVVEQLLDNPDHPR